MAEKRTSYEQHNSEYVSPGKFEYEKRGHEYNDANRVQYNADSPLGKVLDDHPEIDIGVDIGCGTGWVANLMSKTMSEVYAIEPSAAAIDIAKRIYPDNKKVTWLVGFAQDHIGNLDLKGPAIFNCFCVLSHLEDSDVVQICSLINQVAKKGSVLSFSECYGCNYHGHLWHIRDASWWQARFPEWDFSYLNVDIGHPPGAKKAFSALKVR